MKEHHSFCQKKKITIPQGNFYIFKDFYRFLNASWVPKIYKSQFSSQKINQYIHKKSEIIQIN